MMTPDEALAWAKKNPAKAIAQARKLRAARAVQARADIHTFIEYVLRDELTNEPVFQGAIHEEWQTLLNRNDRILIWAPPEHGKTNQISIARPLFELGRNPNQRIAVISNTAGPATKIISSVKRYIEQSAELREVFPHLVRSPRASDPWTQSAITVARESFAKDPSLQSCGLHGAIIGSRIDKLILDDILDPENTRTPAARDDTFRWIKWLMGRLSENATVWCMGNAFHPDDALHRLQKEWGPERWRRTPAIDQHGEPRWPEGGWTRERIEKKRIDLGPLEFARQMLCMARTDDQTRFEQAWINRCFELGKDRQMRTTFSAPDGVLVVIGVDLAVQQHAAADETVIFVIAVMPNGTREVLAIDAGKWTGPVIINRIFAAYNNFNAHKVIVESNSAQAFILQFASDRFAMPIEPFTTTAQNKMHPEFGVESIAAEMAAGKWVFPSQGLKHPELAALEAEMLYYQPGAHTGDRLMAMFFAREGARAGLKKAETGTINWNRR